MTTECERRQRTDNKALDAEPPIASYPIDIKLTGLKKPYMLLFAKVGSPAHTNAGANTQARVTAGQEVVTLHVPYEPGSYELRLITSPGRRQILASTPFRSIPPIAELEAENTAQAGGSIVVRIMGDVSPNSRIQIVEAKNPLRVVVSRSRLRRGLDETVTIGPLPKTKGEYEIRYVSVVRQVVYARKRLTIR